MKAFVVESPAIMQPGNRRVGTMRLYVATEARAKELVAEASDRTYRPVEDDEIPEKARQALELALRESLS